METVTLASPYPRLATNAIFQRREAFAAFELEVDTLYTGSGEPVVRALLEHEGAYTHVCGAPVPAAVAGRGLKILGAFQTSSFALFARTGITSLQQLAGKSVVLAGSVTRPALDLALRRHGVASDAVKVLTSHDLRARGSTDLSLQELVETGVADAVSMNAPDSQAAARAGLQCLLRFGDIFPIPTFALLTTDRELSTRPDRAERMVRGLLQAIDDFIRDCSLGTQLLRQQGVPDDLVEGTYWETRGYLRPDGRLAEDVQRLWIDWSKAELGLTDDVPLSRVFDFSILEHVLEHR